jgi:hypothetical protein
MSKMSAFINFKILIADDRGVYGEIDLRLVLLQINNGHFIEKLAGSVIKINYKRGIISFTTINCYKQSI